MKQISSSVFTLSLIILLFFPIFEIKAQNNKEHTYTISGYITDKKSSETLINASVYDENTMKGSVSNAFGYYTLRLNAGKVKVSASYVGFNPFQREFVLSADTVINIQLIEASELAEVEVIGKSIESNVRGTQMGTVEIPVTQIKKIPTIFGEADVIKALQLLPGVQSGTEGSAGLYVRGGGPDENLMLLDGVPLYNVNHMFGFFSAFNADAIKNVTLYKGNFPARFGGRLSSVVDVRMKDGDMYEYHGNVSVGLIAAKFNIEGPIVKGKTSFSLSGRRTYLDAITAPAIAIISKTNDMGSTLVGSYFYDLNLKINHRFSDKDRLYFSFYSGDDAVYITNKDKNDYDDTHNEQTIKGNWKWGNRIAALRWNHLITPKLFMNVTTTYTQYRHKLNFGLYDNSQILYNGVYISQTNNVELGLNSGIFDVSGKVDFDYKPHEDHDIKFGFDLTHHKFQPSTTGLHYGIGQGDNVISYDTVTGSNNDISAFESALYAEDNWSINNFVKMNAGLHFSLFNVNEKTYASLQPRLSIRILANENLSFKMGYAYMSQYIHMLSSNNISLPTDLWVPVTNNIIPMNSHQVAAGVFYDLKEFEFSVEAYYKHMNNVIEYKDGASFFTVEQTNWEEKVVMGEGYSYGIELLVQRSIGKTTGWIGYTWSKTERLFNRPGQELNFGNPFPAKYDRRHDVSLTVTHKFSNRFDMGLTWIFSTGNCATLALQNYVGLNNENYYYPPTLGYISSRNNYRMGNYQRLDLGFNLHKVKKHGTRTWSLSIYNTTNHNNPFLVFTNTDYVYDYGTEQTVKILSLQQICIFPIIPTLSWSFNF